MASSSTTKKDEAARAEWRLEDKTGQPWIADSWAEAFGLMCQGYTLVDGDLGVQVATGPADGVTPTAPGTPAGGPAAPPKSGAGSGRDAWAEYAAARGVTVPEGASRDDIVGALESAGQPTE